MNISIRNSRDTFAGTMRTIVAATCFPLVLSGCRIPQLRRAEPGPRLPAHFINAEDFSGHPDSRHFHEAIEPANVFAAVNRTEAANSNPASTIQTCFRGYENWITLADASSPADDSTEPLIAPIDKHENTTIANDPFSDIANQPICVGDGPLNWQNSAHSPWYEFFDDPLLASLIDQALLGNQELKILAQEIWIANNEVDARRGEYLPFINVGAGAGLDKASRYTREGAVEEELEVAPGKAFPEPLPDFLIAANLSWEVDIWRKLRNARDAAAFRYLGTRDGQNYVVTRLVAEVASTYYELLALDNRLETLERTIAIQQQSLEVAQAMKEAGRATELAVQRFQAEVRKNQSEKFIIEQDIIQAENRINFLLGRYPQPVLRASQGFLDLNLRALNIGVPSQLLQNRPDVRQAERELEAAGLDVEVARARFYPSLDITAGVGYQAFNPRYLFITPEALIYNVVGELVMPVINRKAIKAAYRTANAKQIQSVYDYQQTVLNAYVEVVNSMTKAENYGQSIEIKKQQLAALEASVESASKLFQNARTEYVEVLLAQREMMEARMILIETKQQQLAAIINTYQALGGGGGAGFGNGILANCPQ